MTADPDSAMNGTPASFEADSVLDALPEALQGPVQALAAQVEAARHQIQVLQEENERLRDRVEELRQRPDVDPSALVLPLDDEDSEALDSTLSAYIEAVDALLADLPPAPDTSNGSDVSADDTSSSA